jgi:hypothetical protein
MGDYTTQQAYGPWYQAFQGQHAGQTPEQYYQQPGQTATEGPGYAPGSSLGAALDDLAWSQDFQKKSGKAPTDYDWQLHWYQKHGYGTPSFMQPKQQPQPQMAQTWAPPWTYWR